MSFIYLVFIEGNVWSGYESEAAANQAAKEVNGTVRAVHMVRK